MHRWHGHVHINQKPGFAWGEKAQLWLLCSIKRILSHQVLVIKKVFCPLLKLIVQLLKHKKCNITHQLSGVYPSTHFCMCLKSQDHCVSYRIINYDSCTPFNEMSSECLYADQTNGSISLCGTDINNITHIKSGKRSFLCRSFHCTCHSLIITYPSTYLFFFNLPPIHPFIHPAIHLFIYAWA